MKTKAAIDACCDTGSCAPVPSLPKGKRALSRSKGFDKELARLAKALAHPARVRIVQALMKVNACVCGDLVELLPLAQSTVSQHLKVLKLAGVVQGAVEGPKRCYCVNPAALNRLKELLSNL
ncbi:MAG: winged helix-turn-helix transcriptional regulator [Planctomycetes bacterium]|nr:winged helix-turn-helix transcriptional regulator [Planctomycetota bacterium]